MTSKKGVFLTGAGMDCQSLDFGYHGGFKLVFLIFGGVLFMSF